MKPKLKQKLKNYSLYTKALCIAKSFLESDRYEIRVKIAQKGLRRYAPETDLSLGIAVYPKIDVLYPQCSFFFPIDGDKIERCTETHDWFRNESKKMYRYFFIEELIEKINSYSNPNFRDVFIPSQEECGQENIPDWWC